MTTAKTVQNGVGQQPPPAQGQAGGERVRAKEAEPTEVKPQITADKAELETVEEAETLPEEVAGWMERVERGEDVHLATPVTHGGQVLVQSVKQDKKIELPLTEEGVKKGLAAGLAENFRWLAEWCVRLIKKIPTKVSYRKLWRLPN